MSPARPPEGPGCPGEGRLAAYLDGDLAPGDHERVGRHTAACEACSAWLDAASPTRLFARLREAPEPEDLWESIWPGVAAALTPRRSAWDRLWAGLVPSRPRRWAAWAAPALALLVIAVWLGPRLGAPPEAGPDGARLAVQSVQAAPQVTEVPEPAGREFVYLSNPDAEITRILLSDEGLGEVQLTMIVDAGFEGEL